MVLGTRRSAALAWASFAHVDELWAPTRFIEIMLRKNIQVESVPLLVMTPHEDTSIARARFGLEDRYMYLFLFDFMLEEHRINYNHYQPHRGLSCLTPVELLAKWRTENSMLDS